MKAPELRAYMQQRVGGDYLEASDIEKPGGGFKNVKELCKVEYERLAQLVASSTLIVDQRMDAARKTREGYFVDLLEAASAIHGRGNHTLAEDLAAARDRLLSQQAQPPEWTSSL